MCICQELETLLKGDVFFGKPSVRAVGDSGSAASACHVAVSLLTIETGCHEDRSDVRIFSPGLACSRYDIWLTDESVKLYPITP
jgi:hypothetical protein